MTIKKGFVLRKVCGQNVIVGEGLGTINFGKMLVLSDSAAWLWEQALQQRDFTIDSLADALNNEYEITIEEAKNDVSEFISDLKSVEVIE